MTQQEIYRLQIPEGYRPVLDLLETEKAIKELKDFFQKELAAALRLTRVSAPLFGSPGNRTERQSQRGGAPCGL